jgi:ferredoxin
VEDRTAAYGADGTLRRRPLHGAAPKVDNELYVRDYSKCILCYRCVDACGEQYQNTFAIHVAGRGFEARISTEFDTTLPESACVYCGNCIAVCPTGALMFVSEHELRESGEWREEEQTVTQTICPYCGVGCTLELHVQDNSIVKVTSPDDHDITRGNLCVKGRFGFQHVQALAVRTEVRAGAVVLAGGRSSRMGQPKALLDWHGLTAVEHAVGVVREGVAGGPVCVVRAPGQQLPPLHAIVVDDPVADGGPLVGLHAGLGALEGPARSPAAWTRRCSPACPGGPGALGRRAPCRWSGRAQPLLAATHRIAPVSGAARSGARGLRDVPWLCRPGATGRRCSKTGARGREPYALGRNANTPRWDAHGLWRGDSGPAEAGHVREGTGSVSRSRRSASASPQDPPRRFDEHDVARSIRSWVTVRGSPASRSPTRTRRPRRVSPELPAKHEAAVPGPVAAL